MPTEIITEHETAHHELVWPEWVYPYSAGAVGGALGSLVVAVVGSAYGLISGAGVWLPINLVAAVFMREMQTESLTALAEFNFLAVLLGLALHLTTSITLGLMFTFLLPALPGRPLYWGPVIGPLLWVGAFLAALPVLNPIMASNIEPISFTIANILYGLVLGLWIDRTEMIHVDQ